MPDANNKKSKLERISKMLELGGTMLAQHCERCGAPLFRYKGEVVCPVCSAEDNQSREQLTAPPAPTESRSSPAPEVTYEPPQSSMPDGSVVVAVHQKMLELSEALRAENDPRRISEILDAIKKAAETIRALKG
ncbi:Sjogren's syndrome/scleroderma autoantigen 1 family protein [Methermicoccus shengliensis]|uniref:Uncharacterized protein n=1 Tax=Methermicoccus shengliensis TaxID=660064 RepID=A0A832RXH3_9EURY|nr:Sjogren's syndrome/scleroderma autoantigen 1 family protein [Methermicoccus shengliensis]KUK04437.1 MAG: Sjogrens syndrome scleroderma autoantigen 1 [Euryarchaeota archaeon 55_53]KUK30556.1 MAG: Sjogrens syndrome scleroderma autoantigen 1 [Methanosarcinales archeaon 56_1174]MDI3488084.1 hypothetical protein [Methanosarcinales archaeon]MDN5295717.1 hypothetical protein [Methanosarcinales archaeon]HIH70149.1 hypothetical protein [Methermicoccus shengliensis]